MFAQNSEKKGIDKNRLISHIINDRIVDGDDHIVDSHEHISVIAKMAELLDVICRDGAGNPSDLSRRLGIPRTTVHRILQTLVDLKMLTSTYEPGPRLLQWAAPAYGQQGLEIIAQESLQRLVGQFRDTASVYVRTGAARVCIGRLEGTEAIRHRVHVGAVLPLHIGSGGRVLLAWLDDETRNRLIQQSIAWSQVSLPRITPDWRQIRHEGWAFTQGERDPILASVSVPIFEGADHVAAALSISGPSGRFDRPRVLAMVQELQKEAQAIRVRWQSIDPGNPDQEKE